MMSDTVDSAENERRLIIGGPPPGNKQLQGLHSILDSGLQSLKDSVFTGSAIGAPPPKPDQKMTLQSLSAANVNQ